MKERLFAFIQYILPHHLVSRAVYCFVESTCPRFKNALIRRIIKQYDVDMSEAERENPEDYLHFNDFFTRSLKEGMRPLPEDNNLIVSPADGEVSQLGDIQDGRVFQAKGHDYSLIELLGGDSELGQEFMGGKFATIYLSPRDYHRVHIPFGGTLRKMIHVPGRLFSVNQGTVENIPNLFARNERVVAIYDTERGPMAVIMVGAMIVASIETVWAGLVTPVRKKVRTFYYGEDSAEHISLNRGDEMGRFKMGSTAIVLFGKDQIDWLEQFEAGSKIKMGQALASPVK
ncbi:archaetidylserine decarboxylase [Endozoicomonas numazuensis]|uniref:Phosphatidylserine decarboxylase proenzyme n=1 Tax=Endozoicomonas numazuensis TaxID=1137799 RepID=A0A081NII7_9GAMM|nr:archaetidylserine decarboxylase [Endozoicomonas numazuensis]KEQ18260.1 phosphatidylserine decarboxylase [Endozoicomonas numazuensis]